jgi:O-antigen ligase
MGNLALGGKRIVGAIGNLFDNPNDLALHLVTFFPIVLGLGFASRNPVARIVYLAVSMMILAGTVVTFSRGGFIGLLFVVGSLIWRYGRRNRTLLGIVGVLLISGFLILAPGVYRQRLATTGDESSQSRLGELKRSIFLAARHPVFGVGMDNFVLYSNTEHATHNSYTQVASEIGLPAAIVYVLFLIAAFRRVRRIPHPKEVSARERWLPHLAIGVQSSLIGFMVTSFFASVAFLWYAYYLVAYAICVSRLHETSVPIQKKSLPLQPRQSHSSQGSMRAFVAD